MGAQEPKPSADGRIEAATDGVVVGWAHRPGSSDPVEVEIRIGGEPVGRLIAKEGRASLKRAGLGRGRHGFRFEVPNVLRDGRHDLAVRVLPDGPELRPAEHFDGRSTTGPWAGVELVHQESAPTAEPHEESPGTYGEIIVDGLDETGLVGSAPPGTGIAATIAGITVGTSTAGPTGRFALPIPETDRAVAFSVVGPGPTAAVVGAPFARVGRTGRSVPALACRDDDAAERPPVLLGLEDWVFDWWGSGSIDQDGILAAVRTLEDVSGALTSIPVAYLPVFVPSRAGLEAHRLPAGVATPDTATRLLAAARASDHVDLLDLGPALADAREDGEVTQRTSDALTERAAFAGARAVAKRLRSLSGKASASVIPTFALGPAVQHRGTLCGRRMLHETGGAIEELAVRDVPAKVLVERIDRPDWQALLAKQVPVGTPLAREGRRAVATEREDGLGDVVLFGTGVDEALLRWLAEHTARLTWIAEDVVDLGAVELSAPDCVVHVIREQRLDALPG